MQQLSYQVDAVSAKTRLDVYLAGVQSEISRSRLQKLIDDDCVSVNGAPAVAKYKVKAGDRVEIRVPSARPLDLPAEPISLNIVYEDDCMVVVDKPPGMVVHPAPGHSKGTLVNALLHHCKDLSGIGGVERPGIVHRLDKDTSGLVLVAKTEAAHKSLARQFKQREIRKVYLALVRGQVKKDKGVIDAAIGRHKVHRKKMATQKEGGREATTEYEVLACYPHFSYLRLFPKTGRTHQIRVHVASLGHPILGDATYGGKVEAKYMKMQRQALHAHRLELSHPLTGEPQVFICPLPADMEHYLESHSPIQKNVR